MKSITQNITSLAVMVLLFAAASYAQNLQPLVVQADVPFEFSVGQKTFPAGQYRVFMAEDHIVSLRGANNAFMTTIITGSVMSFTEHPTARLKFDYVDGHYVLDQVWPSGTARGYQLFAPKFPTGLAKNRPAAGAQTSMLTSTTK